MRKLIIGIAAFLFIVLALAWVGPNFVPADSLKADIAEQVEAATGRKLVIDGDLAFTVLPAPGVAASGLRLSNAEGAHSADMVRLRGAQIQVALLPLLSGDIQVARIVLDSPVVELEQFADGGNNWTFVPQDGDRDVSSAAPGADSAAATSDDSGTEIAFDEVVVRNGVFNFRAGAEVQRFSGIDLALTAASLNGPFRGNGRLAVRGIPLQFEAAIGELQSDRGTPVNVRLTAANATMGFSGIASGLPDAPRLAGQLTGEAVDAARTAAQVGGKLPFEATKLTLEGNLTADGEGVAVNDLSLRLGEIAATGAVDLAFGDTPEAGVVLNIGQLDLDKMLAALPTGAAPGGGAEPAPAGQSGDSPPTARVGAGAANAGFALPSGFGLDVEARVDAIRYRGGLLRQAVFTGQLADGVMTVSQLAVQFPGNGTMVLVGFAAPQNGVTSFEGEAEINADNLRESLSWLGADVAGVSADRLRKLAASAKVKGNPVDLTINDIVMTVDSTQLRGGIAVARRERLGLGIGLSLDRLNLDAYVPADGAAGLSPEPGNAPAASSSGDTTPNPPAADPPARPALAALGDFDAVLQLKAGTISYRGQTIRGVSFDGTLQNGTLDLRDASVQSLAGARASLSGRADGLAVGRGRIDMTLAVDTQEADRLLRLAGLQPSFKVGAGKVTGAVKGDLSSFDLDLQLTALRAQAGARGNIAVLSDEPGYDLAFDVRHPDVTALVALLSGDTPARTASGNALAATASLSGGLTDSKFDLSAKIGRGEVVSNGALSGVVTGRPTGTVTLNASHPDFVEMVRIAVPDYTGARSRSGPVQTAGGFSLSTDLQMGADTVQVTKFAGKAGQVTFAGGGTVTTSGPRPRVAAELSSGEIIVDHFLPRSSRAQGQTVPPPPGAAAVPQRAAPKTGRWSQERLDLSGLRSLDGQIEYSAPAVTYTDLRVDSPRIQAKLNDGVLELTELSGNAYGGTFSMQGRLADTNPPAMRYAVTIDGADAARLTATARQGGRGVMSALDLLFPVSSVRIASGTIGARLDVSATGASEQALVGNLDGSGSVTFTDAAVEGVDLCRISKQLDNLRGLDSFLNLALSARGGRTQVANYAGRFDLARGIATLPEQTIQADCANVAFAGKVDLPRWLVDIQAKATFPEHEKFPGIVVEEKGSLDAPNTRLVNANQVQQYIVGKAAGSVLRKLLPRVEERRESGGQHAPPEDVEQPQVPFQNLLEGLIKRR